MTPWFSKPLVIPAPPFSITIFTSYQIPEPRFSTDFSTLRFRRSVGVTRKIMLLKPAIFGSLLVTAVNAAAFGALDVRSIAAAGGWSLSTPGNCPAGSATCFSNLTGNALTTNRMQNCCPYGTTPRLDCGTYVNTGQPYACCPLGKQILTAKINPFHHS